MKIKTKIDVWKQGKRRVSEYFQAKYGVLSLLSLLDILESLVGGAGVAKAINDNKAT